MQNCLYSPCFELPVDSVTFYRRKKALCFIKLINNYLVYGVILINDNLDFHLTDVVYEFHKLIKKKLPTHNGKESLSNTFTLEQKYLKKKGKSLHFLLYSACCL